MGKPSFANGSGIAARGGPPPNAPNRAERKSSACAEGTNADAANANLRGAFGTGIRHVRFEPGQLVLFPSCILHDVKPFEGEGDRITVAFNCWFNLKDDAPPRV